MQELVSGAKTTYTYDVQGQLLTAENSDGRKEQYTYDTYGNLRSFDNGITQHTYTYGDGDWKDLLTALDGHALTYDAIGNPTGYYNGAAYGMAWTEGRRLGSVTVGGKSFTYTYDRNGIRSGKTSSDGSSRKYYLVDGKVVGETVYKANGSFAYNLRYTFDENGSVCGVSYWGPGATAWTKYYFTKNLQGDVTAVYRVEAANNQIAGFTKVASYTYDAWGNVLSQSGDFAEINPFRYRSYYYDTETGFYYLQSRYYDPAIGRFVSADSFASTGQSFLGYNMFAYCNNNPVQCKDLTGTICVDALRDGRESAVGMYGGLRDVTEEVDRALEEAIAIGREFRDNANSEKYDIVERVRREKALYEDFYWRVKRDAQWDIKRKDPWTGTIGTPYPGARTMPVVYHGHVLTLEDLGNLTYGILGRERGIPLIVLIGGSYYAADFPIFGSESENEFNDWQYIYYGYEFYPF